MINVAIDLNYDHFAALGVKLEDGMDVTQWAPVVNGIAPDLLVVTEAEGIGGGNPDCVASFVSKQAARDWFAWVSDDDDPEWFEENLV